MEIIPVINCNNIRCVQGRMDIISHLGASWAQIDVADGVFAPIKTWSERSQIFDLKPQILKFSNINIEAHLMVQHPLEVVDEWISCGVKRIIFHAESLTPEDVEHIAKKVDVGIALLPETPISLFDAFARITNFVQILAVDPGFSGGQFQEAMIEKIVALRGKYPDVCIEVDGGINFSTAEKIKYAGATIATSGSFIFNSENPREAYEKLCSV